MQRNGKIQPIEELAEMLASCHANGTKLVLCHGVFDLLHVGHIRHLNEAKNMADILVVTITPDRFVNKGLQPFEWVKSGRAVFNSVLVEINEKTGKALSIERVDEVVE